MNLSQVSEILGEGVKKELSRDLIHVSPCVQGGLQAGLRLCSLGPAMAPEHEWHLNMKNFFTHSGTHHPERVEMSLTGDIPDPSGHNPVLWADPAGASSSLTQSGSCAS